MMENLQTVVYNPTLKDRFRWNLIQPVKDWNHDCLGEVEIIEWVEESE